MGQPETKKSLLTAWIPAWIRISNVYFIKQTCIQSSTIEFDWMPPYVASKVIKKYVVPNLFKRKERAGYIFGLLGDSVYDYEIKTLRAIIDGTRYNSAPDAEEYDDVLRELLAKKVVYARVGRNNELSNALRAMKCQIEKNGEGEGSWREEEES